MSLLPCPNKVGCESDIPLTNFSSEDPDPRSFIGYSTGTAPTSAFTGGGGAGPQGGHGPDSNDTGDGVSSETTGTGGEPPPLGSDYDNPTVTTFTTSDTSQNDANADAGNDNVSALADDPINGSPGGGYRFPPSFKRPPVYANTAQSCTVNCADGSQFTFTVPAGRFRAFSLAQANAAALSFACKQAILNRLCLSDMTANLCVGESFSATIRADTPNVPVTFLVTSGTFPAWVNAFVADDSVTLSGTPGPGDIASSTFTITAIDEFGTTASKAYTITVTSCDCTISTSTLDKFDQGQPYSFQLVSTAIAPETWTLVSGTLPAGLSLSSGGLISGTASLVNGNLDQTFTVMVTGDDGGSCSKTLTLEVIDYASFPTGKHWRIQGYVNGMFPVPPGPFGCDCFGSGAPITVWNGEFNTGGGAVFLSNQANGVGEVSMLTNTPNGVKVSLKQSGHVEWENNAWMFIITCAGGNSWVWLGIKSGSNQGAKLDSPAGQYDLFASLPGSFPICSSTGSIIIEEY